VAALPFQNAPDVPSTPQQLHMLESQNDNNDFPHEAQATTTSTIPTNHLDNNSQSPTSPLRQIQLYGTQQSDFSYPDTPFPSQSDLLGHSSQYLPSLNSNSPNNNSARTNSQRSRNPHNGRARRVNNRSTNNHEPPPIIHNENYQAPKLNIKRRINNKLRDPFARIVANILGELQAYLARDPTSEDSGNAILAFNSALVVFHNKATNVDSLTLMNRILEAPVVTDAILALFQEVDVTDKVYPLPNNNHNFLPAHIDRRVKFLVDDNQLSKAMSCITSWSNGESIVPHTDQQAKETLIRLHPLSTAARDTIPALPLDIPIINITSDELDYTINSLPNGSSPGLQSWTYETVKIMYQSHILKGPILDLINKLINGLGGSPVPWNSALLLPISKPTGGVRPIAIAGVWSRIASIILARKFAPVAILSPLQFGVGVKSGAEHLSHLVRSYVSNTIRDNNENNSVYQIDCSNAFNSIARRPIFDKLLASHPLRPLARFYSWSYGSRSPLYDSAGAFICNSETGVRQGDPLGPLLFSLGIQDQLTRVSLAFPEVQTLAYLDDISLLGPLNSTTDAFNFLRQNLLDIGIAVNLNKSKIFTLWEGALHNNPLPVQSTQEGIVTLGCPIGINDFVLTKMSDIINEYTIVLPVLSNLPPRYAFLLLQACIHSRPSYLSRLVPSDLGIPSFNLFDSRISKSLYSILNHGNAQEIINGLPRTLAHLDNLSELPFPGNISHTLPTSMGGIGFRSVSQSSPAAFLASTLNSLQWIRLNIHDMFELVSSVALTTSIKDTLISPHLTSVFENNVTSVAELNDYLQSITTAHTPSQKSLTHLQVDLPSRAHLLEELRQHPHHRAFFLSAMSNTAPTWLKNIKSRFPDYALSGNELLINLRLLLFLPIVAPPDETSSIRCACNLNLINNSELYHCFSCQSGQRDNNTGAHGITFKRHNDVCRALKKFLETVYPNAQIQLEEELPVNEQGNGQRMDLTLRRGDNVVLFDVVVTNPAGPTNMAKRSDIYPLKSANHSFKLKKYHFQRVYPRNGNLAHLNDCLVPLAFETTGAICEESLRYLDNMVKNAKALAQHGGAIGTAYSYFLRCVASIMARSRARHVSFFQAHATRQPIHGRSGLDAVYPYLDDDGAIIDLGEDQMEPNLSYNPHTI
jgi:Reverse transcriptase (RNA-dependent DNA polymerase)